MQRVSTTTDLMEPTVATGRLLPVSEWVGLLALVAIVLASPFLYDLAAALGLAH